MQQRYRTIWISDIHLGRKDCKAKFLLNFLQSMRCEQLYVVGDLIDFWSLRRGGGGWLQSHSQVLQALLAKSTQEGVRLIYVPGNHDGVVRDYIGLAAGGVAIMAAAVHETADGRRFLVIHGDECDSLAKYGNPLKRWLGDWLYELLLWSNRWLDFTRRRFGYPYWSLASAIKPRIGKAARYIARFEAAAVHEAARRGLDGVICGHIHKAELREIDGLTYCNDGDWVESCTALAEHPDGSLEILYWADETLVMLQERRRAMAARSRPGLAEAG